MTPQCYSDHLPTNYTKEKGLKRQLCEPIHLAHEMTFNRNFVHDQIIREVDEIEKHNINKSQGKEQVLKCAMFVFYRYCLHRFKIVIVCIRDKESWIKSAKNHGTFSWIYKAKPNWINSNDYFNIINSVNPEQAFYDYWHAHCKNTIAYCIKKDIQVINYEYADDESFIKLHKTLGLPVKKHDDYEYWLKRRF